jgi:glycosyltransferase involved in cell wall biosynthesis
LESVINQTYKNVEIILINDGSKENITPILNEYGSKIKYYYQENAGQGTSRNNGISFATGEYVISIDPDDIYVSDAIEKLLNYIKTKGYKWAHAYYTTFWDDDYSKTIKREPDFSGNVMPRIFFSCPIAMLCAMIERKILIENPQLRFHPKWKVAPDGYMWQNIAMYYPLGQLKEHIGMVRLRGANSSQLAKNQLLSRSQNIEMLKKCKSTFRSKFLYQYTLLMFYLCRISNNLIDKLHLNKKYAEYLAKVLYAFPYYNLRFIRLFYN